jgi:hypothetical protein
VSRPTVVLSVKPETENLQSYFDRKTLQLDRDALSNIVRELPRVEVGLVSSALLLASRNNFNPATHLHIPSPKHTIRRFNRFSHPSMRPSTLVHATEIRLRLVKRPFAHTSRKSRQPGNHRHLPAHLAQIVANGIPVDDGDGIFAAFQPGPDLCYDFPFEIGVVGRQGGLQRGLEAVIVALEVRHVDWDADVDGAAFVEHRVEDAIDVGACCVGVGEHGGVCGDVLYHLVVHSVPHSQYARRDKGYQVAYPNSPVPRV